MRLLWRQQDGTLSNFDLRPGNYVQELDKRVAALLDRKQLYVMGYFEETKLDRIHIGDEATVQLMGDRRKLKAMCRVLHRVLKTVSVQVVQKLLANVNPTFSWVRLAQRCTCKNCIRRSTKK